MVSSFVIAEGEQRTPKDMGVSKGRRKDTGVVSGRRLLFWISHNLCRKPFAAAMGRGGRHGLANPVHACRWPECAIVGIDHRALLAVGGFGKCRGRTPGPGAHRALRGASTRG